MALFASCDNTELTKSKYPLYEQLSAYSPESCQKIRISTQVSDLTSQIESNLPSHDQSSHIFNNREARQPLDEIINRSFPIIQPIITHLQENNQLEAAVILRLCMKIFWSYTHYALPLHTQSQIDVTLWFNIMSKLMLKRLPEAVEGIEPFGQPVDEDERRKWPWWKVRGHQSSYHIIVCHSVNF